MNIRAGRPDDAPKLIACIRDEYAETYLRQSFYDPKYVRALLDGTLEGAQYQFYVAELDGEVAGMLAIKRKLPRETSCELSSGVVLQKYRRRGIMNALFDRVLEEITRLEAVTAVECIAVTYHDFVQRAMECRGFTPCGLILSTLLIDRIDHSFMRDDNVKHPHALLIRAGEKRDVGRIYIPREHRAITSKIYSELGVAFEIASDGLSPRGASELTVENDDGQRNCSITVARSGEDFSSKLEAIHEKFSGSHQTFNVFLNVNDEGAIAAYEQLRRAGYYFTGFKPLCSERELMILHNPRGVSLDLHSIVLTKKFADLRDYVERSIEP